MTKQIGGRLLSRKELERKVALSRVSIDAKMVEGTFPLPLRTEKQSVAWRESDIDGWIASLPTANRNGDNYGNISRKPGSGRFGIQFSMQLCVLRRWGFSLCLTWRPLASGQLRGGWRARRPG